MKHVRFHTSMYLNILKTSVERAFWNCASEAVHVKIHNLQIEQVGEIHLSQISTESVILEVDGYEICTITQSRWKFPIHFVAVQMELLQSLALANRIWNLATQCVHSEIQKDQVMQFGYICTLKSSLQTVVAQGEILQCLESWSIMSYLTAS